MKIPPGFAQLAPYLFVDDAVAYMAFLESAFGAVELGRTVAPDGRLANGHMKLGEVAFMLSEASPPRYPPTQASFYLYVDDADAALERALSAGASLDVEIGDMPYGDRQCGVRDPAGNLWWLSQRLVDEPYY